MIIKQLFPFLLMAMCGCKPAPNTISHERLEATLNMQRKVERIVAKLKEDCDSSTLELARMKVAAIRVKQQQKVKRK
jgi:hypothetical protein